MILPQIRKHLLPAFLFIILLLPFFFLSRIHTPVGEKASQIRCSNQDKESVCGKNGYSLKLRAPNWEGAWYVTGKVESWGNMNAVIAIGEDESVTVEYAKEVPAVCLPASPSIPPNEPYTLADTYLMSLLLLPSDKRLSIDITKELFPVNSTMVAVAHKDTNGSYDVDHIGYFGCETISLVASIDPVR